MLQTFYASMLVQEPVWTGSGHSGRNGEAGCDDPLDRLFPGSSWAIQDNIVQEMLAYGL
jgi:hypothetical protein